jgi:chemotaxis protein MotA
MAMTEAEPGIERILTDVPGERRPRERDDATWIGLGASALLLIAAAAVGGSLAAYVDLPAFLMVVLGTAAVTMISFPLDEFLRLPRVAATVLVRGVPRARFHAERLLDLAERARRLGLFSLEDQLPRHADDRFLARALAMVVDNVPPDEIERRLRAQLQSALLRHRAASDMLRRGGEVAPAMGLIGTLVGLVQMLANLNTPSSIGPAMAVAILATLYGAVLANVVLLPFAAKLDRNSQAEALVANLTIMTAVSIAAQESPRRLEATLNGVLPPADRVAMFD